MIVRILLSITTETIAIHREEKEKAFFLFQMFQTALKFRSLKIRPSRVPDPGFPVFLGSHYRPTRVGPRFPVFLGSCVLVLRYAESFLLNCLIMFRSSHQRCFFKKDPFKHLWCNSLNKIVKDFRIESSVIDVSEKQPLEVFC